LGSKPAITSRERIFFRNAALLGGNLTYPSILTERRDTSSYPLHSVTSRRPESPNISILENFSLLRSGLKVRLINYHFTYHANEIYTRFCDMQKPEYFVYFCVSEHTRDSLGFSCVVKQR